MDQDPAALLRDRGFRVTAQRLAVLRAVRPGRHLTVDEVAEAVRAEVGAISLQAVYDALGLLTDVGLVRRLQPAGSATVFEARVADNHHHLVCRVCGRMSDVDCAIGLRPLPDAERRPGLRDRRGRGHLLGPLPRLPRPGQRRGHRPHDKPSPALAGRGMTRHMTHHLPEKRT